MFYAISYGFRTSRLLAPPILASISVPMMAHATPSVDKFLRLAQAWEIMSYYPHRFPGRTFQYIQQRLLLTLLVTVSSLHGKQYKTRGRPRLKMESCRFKSDHPDHYLKPKSYTYWTSI
jgi:hypothetical protein